MSTRLLHIPKTDFSARFNEVKVNIFEFPGGEVGVKIIDTINLKNNDEFIIYAKIQKSSDFMAVALLKNAIENLAAESELKVKISLSMGYVPYARQDRVCDAGESNSIKVFANLINSLNFDSVVIVDPHSDVAPALINKVKVIPQHKVFEFAAKESKILKKFFEENFDNYIFVAPDAGALKKVYKVSNDVACCNKIRDTKDGKILGMNLSQGNVKGKACLILDDICDGGRTFTECAKILRENGAIKVGLFVTHGILSKGLDCLKNDLDFIVTTDSLNGPEEFGYCERVKIFFKN